ncbi:hypothetical protein L6452_37517 [Arctium lappa]|uniref:Uncharacterized protein n=1 Tax=Arctium lappa TaxID=4217 RepID=A0ACB8Y3X2_ARCLA|nr:hypothetical protein L6452_37517 [Arctium lappa]
MFFGEEAEAAIVENPKRTGDLLLLFKEDGPVSDVWFGLRNRSDEVVSVSPSVTPSISPMNVKLERERVGTNDDDGR